MHPAARRTHRRGSASNGRRWIVTGACALALAGSAAVASQLPAGRGGAPLVVTADIDGLIHPVAAQFVARVLDHARSRDAALVVLTLRTPGGLVDSTRDINNAIIASSTPVAVFVGPSGNRAASAGFLITIAADIAAMAPGTHIGAAHPVAGDGSRMDETASRKAASDVAGYARTLAARRQRNVGLVEQAVTESRSYTEQEAVSASPPLIDLVAADVPDLLKKLDGREVARFDGRTATLRTAGAVTERLEMTRAQRFLSTLAHPQVAYLLFTLGLLGLTVEFWNPGAVFPGVAGGICLLLAFFAFQVLPINYAGAALIAFGIVLLILELKVTSFGLLGTGGTVSVLLGSMMLIDSPVPALQVGWSIVIPTTLAVAGVILFLVGLGLRAQRAPAVTGEAGMLGVIGRALSAIEPGGTGRVEAHGEIWTATAAERIAEGDTVRVTAVEGLRLTVTRQAAHVSGGNA